MTIKDAVFWCGVYWLCSGVIHPAVQWLRDYVPGAWLRWRRSRHALVESK